MQLTSSAATTANAPNVASGRALTEISTDGVPSSKISGGGCTGGPVPSVRIRNRAGRPRRNVQSFRLGAVISGLFAFDSGGDVRTAPATPTNHMETQPPAPSTATTAAVPSAPAPATESGCGGLRARLVLVQSFV